MNIDTKSFGIIRDTLFSYTVSMIVAAHFSVLPFLFLVEKVCFSLFFFLFFNPM